MSDEPKKEPTAADTDEVLAQIKTMVDLPETASDVELITVLVNIIANLQERYEGLLADAVKMEEKLANRDFQDFADILPENTHDFWKEQLLMNREAALSALGAIREQTAKQVEPQKSPPTPTVPLRNRLSAISRGVETIASGAPATAREESLAVKIRNRAHQIKTEEGVPFIVAFGRAEKELTTKE